MNNTFNASATKWAICDCCEGDGYVSNSAFDRGFTSEEWQEMRCEFDSSGVSDAERYLDGAYDVPCNDCKGTGKVRVPDESRMDASEKRAYRQWKREQRDIAESRYTDALMRRAEMGLL